MNKNPYTASASAASMKEIYTTKTEDVNRTTRAKRQISHNVIDGIPWDTAFIDADKFQTAFNAQVPI